MEKTQVQKEFEAICAVPRCSGHNEKIIAYVIDQAKQLGLEYVYDEQNGNVLIRKPAMIGKRDRMAVILQGHLDMVAQVRPGIEHDFTKDPLDVRINGDYYYAEGTTLGADNGVAAAIALALLKDETLQNPPMEVLLTTDEEVGMLSVKDADFSYLHGRYLINLDSGEEGSLIIGCCGGTKAAFHFPIEEQSFPGVKYTISVQGLAGGHSGIEIDKERANAIKLMAQLLLQLSKQADFRLKSFHAEGKDNAISNNAAVEIVAKKEEEDAIRKLVRQMQRNCRVIFRKTDPKIRFAVETEDCFSGEAFTKDCGLRFISFLVQLPSGVIKREQDDFTKPETSANVGIVKTGETTVDVIYSIRSSVAERAELVAAKVENLADLVGAEAQITAEYPAWLPDRGSLLIPRFRSVYKQLYGKEPVIDTVHAGLECGYLLQNSQIEAAISLGAQVIGEHTTEEKLSISSLNRTYEYVKKTIESM